LSIFSLPQHFSHGCRASKPLPCYFLASRASRSGPLTRSDAHDWDMIRLSVSNPCAGLLMKLGWWRSPGKHAAVGYHHSHPPFVLTLHRCYIGIICAFNLTALTGPSRCSPGSFSERLIFRLYDCRDTVSDRPFSNARGIIDVAGYSWQY